MNNKLSKKFFLRFSFLLIATMIVSILPSIAIKADTLPTTQLLSTQSSYRLFGSDRYATNIAISQKGWTSADSVILASGVDYADALCAGPLAKKYSAPILLSAKGSVSSATLNEISRLKATKVIIVGGTGAVSAYVQSQVEALSGVTVTRIGGKDRYETSVLIAAQMGKPTTAVIASGNNFPDALAVSSIASNLGYPILLSDKAGLSNVIKKYITDTGITKTYIIGGTGVLYPAVETQVPNPTRLSGKDRFETNLAVLKEFDNKLNYDNVYLVAGSSFADALSSAVLAANTSSPLILTDVIISENVKNYIKGKITLNTKVIAIGGESVVSSSLVSEVTLPVNNGGSQTIAVNAITTSPKTMTLTTGGEIGIITATIAPSNATNINVNWSSSNTSVATVVAGVVKSGAAGTAIIKATSAADVTKTTTILVTVKIAGQATGMSVNLGEAGNYAILAKTGISTVPTSAITGDIGVSPITSTAITGFGLSKDATNVFSTSSQVIGKVYSADYASPTPSNLTTAISNMQTAYTDAAGRAPNYTELYSGDISGRTLAAGVYKWGTGVLINSDVTLNGGANDVWIFQIDKGITQAANTKIILTGGAQAKNIYWQAAQTVEIKSGAHFEGIILCQTNIALRTNTSINGRLLAQTAVTLDKSIVVAPAK